MKICNNCKCPNDDEYVYCRNCGSELKKSQKPILLFVIASVLGVVILTVAGYGVWYLTKPNLHVSPEHSLVEFDAEGGTVEMPIHTDADYSEWHVSDANDSWVTVSKNAGSITIKCDENDSPKTGVRVSRIYLWCDGRSENVRNCVVISQAESNQYVQGEITSISYDHNCEQWTRYEDYRNGMKINVKYKLRHWSDGDIRCAVWFYDSEGNVVKHDASYYSTDDNQLTIQEMTYPGWSDDGSYEVSLFIPYSEFPYGSGTYYCKLSLFEYESDSDGRKFADKDFENKTFTVNHN